MNLLKAKPIKDSLETLGALAPARLNWLQVAAIGIAIAISGNLSGWNYGLEIGGWGGMLLAALAMAVLFWGLAQSIAELAASLPEAAGGFDGYVRRGLGSTMAFVAGMSVALALSVGAGLAVSFGEAYVTGWLGWGGMPVKAGLVALVAWLQLRGAREAVALTSLIGVVTVSVLIVCCAYLAPLFEFGNLFTLAADRHTLLPHGWAGALGSIPFALFLFLGVEQAAHAGADMDDVRGGMPKALLAAVGVAFLVGIAVLILATGATGVSAISHSDAPLYTAVTAHSSTHSSTIGAIVMAYLVGAGAPIALCGTFFSLTYAGSRQWLHLAQSRCLPQSWATVNAAQAPSRAIALLSVIALLAAVFPPDAVMVLFTFLLSISHGLLLLAFLALRVREPKLPRPYCAKGGLALAGVSLVLSFMVMLSCYRLAPLLLSVAVAMLSAATATFAHFSAARPQPA